MSRESVNEAPPDGQSKNPKSTSSRSCVERAPVERGSAQQAKSYVVRPREETSRDASPCCWMPAAGCSEIRPRAPTGDQTHGQRRSRPRIPDARLEKGGSRHKSLRISVVFGAVSTISRCPPCGWPSANDGDAPRSSFGAEHARVRIVGCDSPGGSRADRCSGDGNEAMELARPPSTSGSVRG